MQLAKKLHIVIIIIRFAPLEQEFENKIKSTGLVKRAVLHSLLLILLWTLGGKGALQGVHYQYSTYSNDFSQSSFEKVHDFDPSSLFKVFVELDEEVEDENVRHAAADISSQSLSVLSVLNDISGVSLFSSKRIIKLYILFHSWKSFLFI